MKKVTYWMCVYLFTFLPFISLSAQNGENLKKKKNFISNLMKKMTLDINALVVEILQDQTKREFLVPNKYHKDIWAQC